MAIIEEKLSYTRKDADGNEVRFYPETKAKFVTDDNGKSIEEMFGGGGGGGWDGRLTSYVELEGTKSDGSWNSYTYDLMQAGELPRYIWGMNKYSSSSIKGEEMQIIFTETGDPNDKQSLLQVTSPTTSSGAVEMIVPVPKEAKFVSLVTRGSKSSVSCRAYY